MAKRQRRTLRRMLPLEREMAEVLNDLYATTARLERLMPKLAAAEAAGIALTAQQRAMEKRAADITTDVSIATDILEGIEGNEQVDIAQGYASEALEKLEKLQPATRELLRRENTKRAQSLKERLK